MVAKHFFNLVTLSLNLPYLEVYMSGRRIDDHGSWMGKGGKYPLPEGPYKLKEERSAEGSGHIGMNYPDTTEDIRRDQMAGDSKAKGRAIKPGYRN
jgi:hypothetical protein